MEKKVGAVGVAYGVAAYLLWGLLPVYWKALKAVSAPEVLAHRILWAAALVSGLLVLRGRWGELKQAVRSVRVRNTFLVTSMLLAGNWLTYIWAVNAGYVLETSLGYFICPLVIVLLGVVFLKEKLRPVQKYR